MTQPTPEVSQNPGDHQPMAAHATGPQGELVYDVRCWYCRRGIPTEDATERRYHETVYLDTKGSR